MDGEALSMIDQRSCVVKIHCLLKLREYFSEFRATGPEFLPAFQRVLQCAMGAALRAGNGFAYVPILRPHPATSADAIAL